MLVMNVVVKTAIIYIFTYLFIGEFVSGAWLKLFFEALCFGLRQTQKKKKSLYLQKALSSFFQRNFKQRGSNFSMKYATAWDVHWIWGQLCVLCYLENNVILCLLGFYGLYNRHKLYSSFFLYSLSQGCFRAKLHRGILCATTGWAWKCKIYRNHLIFRSKWTPAGQFSSLSFFLIGVEIIMRRLLGAKEGHVSGEHVWS